MDMLDAVLRFYGVDADVVQDIEGEEIKVVPQEPRDDVLETSRDNDNSDGNHVRSVEKS